jgi:hypothetical protein
VSARILAIEAAQYHADPCATPSLSASIAHTLVSKSPLHAYTEHPKLGGVDRPKEPGTEALNAGAVIHELLLGKGAGFTVINADNFRTKLAQQARDEAIARGRVPIIAEKLDRYVGIAALLRDKLKAKGVDFSTGECEVALEWEDQCADGPVLCRSMWDFVQRSAGHIVDVKTCASANPLEIAKHFVPYGYDVQYAAYTRALAALEPEFEGRIEMEFAFCEIEPPYSVVVRPPDGALREIGNRRWERAVQQWHASLASGHWPDYDDGAAARFIEAPQWDVARELTDW